MLYLLKHTWPHSTEDLSQHTRDTRKHEMLDLDAEAAASDQGIAWISAWVSLEEDDDETNALTGLDSKGG